MSDILEISDLRIRFRSKGSIRALLDRDKDPYIEAVCGASLSIKRGETFALVGESGAGKTTLARSIIGLVKPTSGTILYKGETLLGLGDKAFKPLRREIAMMFQDPVGCLSPRLTIRSIITEPFKIHRMPNVDLDREAVRLLELVGLPATFAGYRP